MSSTGTVLGAQRPVCLLPVCVSCPTEARLWGRSTASGGGSVAPQAVGTAALPQQEEGAQLCFSC